MSTVRYCIICGVNNKENQETLYNFPKCATRRDKWLKILKVEGVIKSTARVCEKHFAKNQLVRNYLKKDALPTLETAAIPAIKTSNFKGALKKCQQFRYTNLNMNFIPRQELTTFNT